MVEEKVNKVRKMLIKGAIPPTEEQIKKSEDASKRLKKIEEKKGVEKRQSRRMGIRGEECYWPASARGTAELSWDELLYVAGA